MNWRAVAFAIYLETMLVRLVGPSDTHYPDAVRRMIASHPVVIGNFNGMWKRESET